MKFSKAGFPPSDILGNSGAAGQGMRENLSPNLLERAAIERDTSLKLDLINESANTSNLVDSGAPLLLLALHSIYLISA